jgi:hypothetical protein
MYRKSYQDKLGDASNVAEESLGSIRTVRSFSNEREVNTKNNKNN